MYFGADRECQSRISSAEIALRAAMRPSVKESADTLVDPEVESRSDDTKVGAEDDGNGNNGGELSAGKFVRLTVQAYWIVVSDV